MVTFAPGRRGSPSAGHGEINGNRLAPVALAREDPVAKAVGDSTAPQPIVREPCGDDPTCVDGPRAFLDRHHGTLTERHGVVVVRERLASNVDGGSVGGRNDLNDGQLVGCGKGVIAFVMCWDSHDRAGPVRAENVVGNPNGEAIAIDGIDRQSAHGDAGLGLGLGSVELALSSGGSNVFAHGVRMFGRYELRQERVLGRQDNVGCARKRVDARREHRDGIGGSLHAKVHLGAFATADPMVLLDLGVRPVERRQVGVEPVRVRSDLEHPLAQWQPLHRMAAALALAIDHFFVGEHRSEGRAPVDWNLGLDGESPLEHLEKDPLCPADVGWFGRVDLSRPVVTQAEHLQLTLERRNVAPRRRARMLSGRYGVLFGRKAECIPAHGMENVHSSHPAEPRHDVGCRVALWVTDVQSGARRIRKHVEDVGFRSSRAPDSSKNPGPFPFFLPFRLDRCRVVARSQLVGHVPARSSTVGDGYDPRSASSEDVEPGRKTLPSSIDEGGASRLPSSSPIAGAGSGRSRIARLVGRTRLIRLVCVLHARKGAGANVGDIALRRSSDRVSQVREPLDEFWHASTRHPEQVRANEHLSPASRPRADSDGRDTKAIGNSRGDVGWHGFDYDGISPRVRNRARVGHDLVGLLFASALNSKSPKRKNALRSEPHVAHHGNSRSSDAPDVFGDILATLEFHTLE